MVAASRVTGPRLAAELSAYLAECQASRQPFSWLENNCCHFAAGWVRRISGCQVMAGLAATPSPRCARRLLLSLGGSLASAWSRQLEAQPIAPLLASVGDLVLLRLHDMPAATELASGELRSPGQAVGVCEGRTVAAISPEGLVARLPLSFGVAAWRLPEPGRAVA